MMFENHIKIGMVTHGAFPPDVRIEKEVSSLIAAGYQVYVYANERLSSTKVAVFEGAKVRYFPFSYSPFFLLVTLPKILRRWFLIDGIKIAHVQDTPLVIPTSIAARSLNLPVVYDIHEIWYRVIAGDVFIPWIEKIMLIFWCKISELIGVKIAKAILVISDEMASYIADNYSGSSNKIHVIRNLSPHT